MKNKTVAMDYKTTSLTMSDENNKLEKNVSMKSVAVEKKKSAMLISKKKLAIKNKRTKRVKLSMLNNKYMKNMHDQHGSQDKKKRLAWSNVMKCDALLANNKTESKLQTNIRPDKNKGDFATIKEKNASTSSSSLAAPT